MFKTVLKCDYILYTPTPLNLAIGENIKKLLLYVQKVALFL